MLRGMAAIPAPSLPALTRRRDGGLGSAARDVARVTLFGVLPVALAVAFLALAAHDQFAFDFHQFWQGGRDVVHGVSPYPALEAVKAADGPALGPEGIQDVFRFPYPAPAAVAMAPFGLLPFGVAAGLLTVLLAAATGLTLRVLDVLDWRCYGVALASVPVLQSLRLGALTPLLALALALAWRFRDRRWVAASALAAAIVLKLFLWPMLLWLVVTRRARTALATAVVVAGSSVLAWAAIGFAGLRNYPALVSELSAAVQEKGYSLVALGVAAGLPPDVARFAALAGGAVALGVVLLVGRRHGDRAAFVAAVGASIALTPIVWLHYFMLLFVPIAIARPRFSPLWALPLAFWITPFPESDGQVWRIVLVVGVAVVALAASGASGMRRRAHSVAQLAPAGGA